MRSKREPTRSCSPVKRRPAYPIQAVQTLAAGHRETPRRCPAERVTLSTNSIESRHGLALCEAAVTLSTTGQASAIVAVTREGKTAWLLSALRPAATIYAATETKRSHGC